MTKLTLNLDEDEYEDFVDLLDYCIECEYPHINNKIALKIYKKLIRDD